MEEVLRQVPLAAASALALIALDPAFAEVQLSKDGKSVSFKPTGGSVSIDYAHAKPVPFPQTTKRPPSQAELINRGSSVTRTGAPGYAPGGDGDGTLSPVKLPRTQATQDGSAGSQEYGTSNQPFTTAALILIDKADRPFRRAGKLFFKIGGSSYVCSASLIKTGVVVTAAHCVAKFGASQFYSGWQYVPAYSNGSAPYGVWTAATAWVPTVYYNGTDSCAQSGVICQNDVALIVLSPQSGAYAGKKTGFFGYGWNGYGFNGSSQGLMSQLGYPVALNSGGTMIRTDSQGATNSSLSNNTIIGSLQTGGSSGGPWLTNLGTGVTLASGYTRGSEADSNIVVGVTSWGYINQAVKQQGASPFTSNNIVSLVNSACSGIPAACQ